MAIIARSTRPWRREFSKERKSTCLATPVSRVLIVRRVATLALQEKIVALTDEVATSNLFEEF